MSKKPLDFSRVLPLVLIGGGGIGLLASFVLTVEKIWWLKDPTASGSCNINPLFSCVSVNTTPQAEVFGVPTTLFGIIAFSVIVTIGVGLVAGARFRPWFWRAFLVGALLGVGAIHWLFSQSVYVINALCIYCMSVWAATMAIAWYSLLANIQAGVLPLRSSVKAFLERSIFPYHALLYASWVVVIAILIIVRFWL